METRDHAKQILRSIHCEKIFTKLPSGWRYCHGTTAPMGYAWINNGKPVLGGQYEHALLKIS